MNSEVLPASMPTSSMSKSREPYVHNPVRVSQDKDSNAGRAAKWAASAQKSGFTEEVAYSTGQVPQVPVAELVLRRGGQQCLHGSGRP